MSLLLQNLFQWVHGHCPGFLGHCQNWVDLEQLSLSMVLIQKYFEYTFLMHTYTTNLGHSFPDI